MVSSHIWTSTSLSHKTSDFSLYFYSLNSYVRACILWPFFATFGWKFFQSRHGLTRRQNWNTRKQISKNMPKRKSGSHYDGFDCEFTWSPDLCHPASPRGRLHFPLRWSFYSSNFRLPKFRSGWSECCSFVSRLQSQAHSIWKRYKGFCQTFRLIKAFSTDFLQSTSLVFPRPYFFPWVMWFHPFCCDYFPSF